MSSPLAVTIHNCGTYIYKCIITLWWWYGKLGLWVTRQKKPYSQSQSLFVWLVVMGTFGLASCAFVGVLFHINEHGIEQQLDQLHHHRQQQHQRRWEWSLYWREFAQFSFVGGLSGAINDDSLISYNMETLTTSSHVPPSLGWHGRHCREWTTNQIVTKPNQVGHPVIKTKYAGYCYLY